MEIELGFDLLHLLLKLLQTVAGNLLSSLSNAGTLPTCSQLQMAVPETWVQGGLCRTLGALPHAANLSLPSPKSAHLAPNQGWGKPPQCLQQLLLPGNVRVRLLLRFSEGSEAATQCGGVSCAVLCCAVQPACAFSCFILKYPLVSFFTSYSLYPKLCISPLNGVIFLIAGRALLLDTTLLLVH